MKASQTFKFDPKLLKALKKHAKQMEVPFNRYAENVFKMHYLNNVIK